MINEDVYHQTLPSFKAETKAGDSRYQWFRDNFGDTCWELDALSPVVLRDRVEDSIFCELDLEAWQQARKIESVEKRSMEQFFQSWKNIQPANRG